MSNAQATTVLRAIQNWLEPHGDIVGTLKLEPDCLSAQLGGLRLAIRAHVLEDKDIHPSIAHVHVIVESEKADLNGHLDACVIGIDSDRNVALHDAAKHWCTAAAGPIFSLMHARPVLDAVHFDGTESWSVSGAHGFAGPMIMRPGADDRLGEQLMAQPLFQFASEMAPPGVIHLAKVTLNVVSNHWRRSIEIDGHRCSYEDAQWTIDVPTRDQAIASRFAVFHYADQKEKVAARQQLDEAIGLYVQLFAREKDMSTVYDQMLERGLPDILVNRVHHFLTLAIGRALLTGSMPIQHAHTYQRVLPSGEVLKDIPLMSEPAFARGMALAHQLAQSNLEAIKQLALCSAEVHVINDLLHSGSKLENIRCVPFSVPDIETSHVTFEKALRSLSSNANPQQPAHQKQKPWWKFW